MHTNYVLTIMYLAEPAQTETLPADKEPTQTNNVMEVTEEGNKEETSERETWQSAHGDLH